MAQTTLSQPEAVSRKYKISDTSLTAFARFFLSLFIQDKQAFMSLNPEFNDPFAENWMAAIEVAENTPTDETVVDIQSQQTQVVLNVMKACRRKYNQIMYFAYEAFEHKPAVLNEFGKDDYLAIRMQQDAMVSFLTNMHSSAVKYSSQLIDRGCTQELINEILTLKNQLATENALQQKMIRERATVTADRIAKYNQVYAFCQKVNRASKQVFVDDYAKIQEYLMPGSENVEEDISFTGTVTRSEDGQPIVSATVTLTSINSSAITDEFGVFAFAQEIPAGTYDFTVTAESRQTFSGSVTLTAGTVVTKNITMNSPE